MTANKQRQTDTMTLYERELTKNVKGKMIETRLCAEQIRCFAESIRETEEYDTVIKCAERFEAEYRWHANTFAMLLAIHKKRPVAELISRRTDIARQILEVCEYLVEKQVMNEQDYLERCDFYKRDLLF